MTKSQVKKGSKKLYQSIAAMLCILIGAIFVWLILSSVIMAQKGISAATFNGLEATSKGNGCQIQEYMNVCQATAKGLVSRIEEVFLQEKGNNNTVKTQDSEVYEGLDLSSVKRELEGYLIGTAKNAVANNQAVIGIGIMFEPYMFTDNRESYALYFTEEDGEVTVSDVGAYEEFSSNDYYQIALDKTDTVFTEPYTYRDMWMITGATPILVDGELVGVINVDVSMDVFNGLSLSNELYPSMSTKIVSASGIVDYDSENADNISKNYGDVGFKNGDDYTALNGQLQSGEQFRTSYRDEDGRKVYSFFYPLQAGGEIWHTVTTVHSSDLQETTIQTVVVLCIIALICLIILVAVVRLTLKKRLAPIASIVDAAESIAAGKLDIVLNVDSKDEIGELAREFLNTSKSLKCMIEDISRILDQIASNNFAVETRTEYHGEFKQIESSIHAIVRNLNSAMKNISEGSGQVSLGAHQMAQTSQELASDASRQASSIDSLSEAIRQIAVKVDESTKKAADAREKVQGVGKAVESSNATMTDMVEAMSKISETSRNIEMIIQNIESIADQTNLLSVNASIEAARAGEAGRGFAVVAGEVQGLSSQSAEAAQNTRVLIEETIQAVENGTNLADRMEESMRALVEQIGTIVSTIEGIAEASGEEKEHILAIEQEVEKISSVVQSNSGSAEESSATSEELQVQAENLNRLLEEFRFQ